MCVTLLGIDSPTIFFGVPRVWEKIMEKMKQIGAATTGLKKQLVAWAKARGADDAWMVEDGVVTEGTSNNAWIVKDGHIVTRARSHDILHGITRAAIMRLAAEAQLTVEERGFTPDEAQAADEAFITSASAFVMPVVSIDGQRLGDGTPGPVARRLREIYLEDARASAL